MTDPRLIDAMRKVPLLFESVEKLTIEVQKLREDNTYMKGLLRDIKKSVTRKYDKKDES